MRGQVLGWLGDNGAGKSTLMKDQSHRGWSHCLRQANL
ncbi:hypothetical protein LB565_09315 [Mesorhizobium sp. CA14]|nr:hypothetical protein [Mesorhizobium sp. CA14]